MALSDYATQGMEKIIRKACIDLYRRIAERTPVDTGRAKANWAISTVQAEPDRNDPDGYSFNEINSIIASEVSGFSFELSDGVVWINNNLEYIESLENGTSKQAPAGMVMVSLAEFETHFNSALQGLKGFEPA